MRARAERVHRSGTRRWISQAQAVLVAAVVMLAVRVAEGAAQAELKLNLAEAVRVSLEQNDELKVSAYGLAAGSEDVGIAKSFLLPRIVFEERFMRTNNPPTVFSMKLNQERFSQSDFAISSLNDPTPVSDFQASLSIEQMLLERKSRVGISVSEKEFEAKREEHQRKREEIALRVVQTYLAIHTAKGYVEAAQQSVNDAREHHRVAVLRYDAGLGLYSDSLRAATAVTEAEQRLVSARTRVAVAKRALGLLLGMSESVDVDGVTPQFIVKDLDYYLSVLGSRRDIAALQARCENARNTVRLAEAAYYPVLGVGGAYQVNDSKSPFGAEGESWFLTAFLRWNLFEGARTKHEVAKARHKVSETEAALDGFRKAVAFKVYEAHMAVDEERKNVALSVAALQTAEEGRRLVKERYENALSPLTDLLDAQVSLDHARASLVSAENNYRFSVAKLGFESGTILKDLGVNE